MFFKRNVGLGNKLDDKYGRLYVLKIILKNGQIVHKVGMCKSSRSIDRMMEIVYSFFKVYRYIPHTELRRDKKVLVPLQVEQHIHRLLKDYKYVFDKKFGGSTEFFIDLDEEVLLDYLDNFKYIDLLEGKTSLDSTIYNNIKDAIEEAKGNSLPTGKQDKLPF